METQNNGPPNEQPSYIQRVLDYTATKVAFTVTLSLIAITLLVAMASQVEAHSTFFQPNGSRHEVLVGYPGSYHQGDYPLLL